MDIVLTQIKIEIMIHNVWKYGCFSYTNKARDYVPTNKARDYDP